jgi:hypothetical protein
MPRIFKVLDAGFYKQTGKSIGGSAAKAPVLRLRTTGYRSATTRETPLVDVRSCDDHLVVASCGRIAVEPALALEPCCDAPRQPSELTDDM